MTAELDALRQKLREAEQALAEASDQQADLQASQGQARERIAQLVRELSERDIKIAQLDDNLVRMAEQQPPPRELIAKTEQAAQPRDQSVALVEQMRTEHEAEVDDFERRLRERASQIDSLRVEVAHRDRLVRELIATLEEQRDQGYGDAGDSEPLSGEAATVEGLRQQLNRLAEQAAEREAALQSAQWKIQELENATAHLQPSADSPSATAELEQALFSAQTELGLLRSRLLQQAQLPVAPPPQTGPDAQLEGSQAEVQHQAVLVAAAEAGYDPDTHSG